MNTLIINFIMKNLTKIAAASAVSLILSLGYCKIQKNKKEALKKVIHAESEKNEALSQSGRDKKEALKYKIRNDLNNKCKLTLIQQKEMTHDERTKFFDNCSSFKYSN